MHVAQSVQRFWEDDMPMQDGKTGYAISGSHSAF